MKIFRLVTTLFLVIIVFLFIKQNLSTFRMLIPFTLDLYIHEKLSWSHQLWALLVTSGAIGFCCALALMTKSYMRIRRDLRKIREEKDELSRQLVEESSTVMNEQPSPTPEKDPEK